MLLETRCPQCGVVTQIAASDATVTCGKCGNRFDAKPVGELETVSYRDARETPAREASETSRPSARPRDLIGRFRLQAVLGEGVAGVVYRAHDPVLDRSVAIKIPKLQLTDEQSLGRFLREARAAAGLRHPHIVAVYEVLQEPQPALVCEFVEGLSLADRLSKGRPDVRRGVQWVHDLADALAYAHARGVVHRDVKPANILVGLDDEAKLSDFGLARRTSDAAMTREGTLLGSPSYMAPEAAREDHQAIGPASDQYSLGVVLFELLTGQRPFEGTSHDVLLKVIGQPPPRPRSLRAEISKDLEAVCLKAMSKQPAQRYATTGEFAADLERWLSGEPVLARRTSPAGAFIRRRWPLVAAAAGAILALAGVLYVQTDAGRLKIESRVDDVDVVVSQAGKEVQVIDLQSGSEVRLRSGRYDLALRGDRNDLKLSAARAELTRGGEVIVTIEKMAEQAEPTAEKSADRQAAQWIINAGGVSTLRTGNANLSVSKLADLPAGDFYISGVVVDGNNNNKIVDDDLKNLADLLGLTYLRSGSSNITGTGLRHLSASTKLGTLILNNSQLNNAGLAEAGRFSLLRELHALDTRISDAGLRHLAKCRLENLNLANTNITDVGVQTISEQQQLQALDVAGTAITDESLKSLSNQFQLHTLGLRSTNVTDAGMKSIASLPALQSLNLQNTRITGAGLEHVAKMPKLTHLTLAGLKVASGLHFLSQAPALEFIQIEDTDVTDDSIVPLAELATLKHFGARNVLQGTTLGSLKSLELLNLTGALRLDLQVGDQVAQLSKLRVLWLDNAKITDETVKAISGLPLLADLNLNSTPITDQSVKHLAEIKTLTVLRVVGTKLTAAGVENLRLALPKCRIESSFDLPAAITNAEAKSPAKFKWEPRNVAGPSARSRFAMAYDADRHVVLLTGGSTGTVVDDETWEWDGKAWNDTRQSLPFPTDRHAMAHDRQRREMVLVSGTGGANLRGTAIEWNGKQWRKSELLPSSRPLSSWGHAMTFDEHRGLVVLFGGAGNNNRTWEWNGVEWKERSTTEGPATGADSHDMTYDATRQVVLLVCRSAGSVETWSWNGTEWKRLDDSGPQLPLGGGNHQLTYDSRRKAAVLVDATGVTTKTWEWTGTKWEAISTSIGSNPARSSSQAVAYDAARDVVVLFGGLRGNETWELVAGQ